MKPHTSEVPSDMGETGAPESSYGDFGGAQPSGDAIQPDPLREALERAYYDWWAHNDHALSVGLPGDVLDLRERLNMAAAAPTSLEKRAKLIENQCAYAASILQSP